MKRKNIVLMASVIATMGVLGVAGSVSAEGMRFGDSDLISGLAKRFNLKTEEVQQYFNEQHEQRHESREAAYKERVDEAVEEGTITQKQADALLARHEEMEKFVESLSDKTTEERREAIREKRAEYQKWAEENDIPTGLFRMGEGGNGMMRGGMRRMHQAQ